VDRIQGRNGMRNRWHTEQRRRRESSANTASPHQAQVSAGGEYATRHRLPSVNCPSLFRFFPSPRCSPTPFCYLLPREGGVTNPVQCSLGGDAIANPTSPLVNRNRRHSNGARIAKRAVFAAKN
jgi:hypothetical protein